MANDFGSLFQGLQMFNQGVQQYATSQAITDATQHVNALNTQAMDQQQKAAQQQQVGQSLAMRLQAIGAPQDQIQGAVGAVSGPKFNDANSMIIAGTQTGNKALVDQGVALNDMISRPQMKELQAKLDVTKSESALQRQHEMNMLAFKNATAEKPLNDVKPEDITFHMHAVEAQNDLNNLAQTVQKAGTWESRLGDPGAAADLNSLAETAATSFVHMQNPTAQARPNMIKEMKDNLLSQMGPTGSKEVLLKQIDTMNNKVRAIQKSRLDVQKAFGAAPGEAKQGANAQALEKALTPNTSGLAPGQQVVEQRNSKTGAVRRVIVDDQGNVIRTF